MAAVAANAQRAAALMAAPNHHAVKIALSHDRLSGTIGFRTFELHADGDGYTGTFKLANSRALPFRVLGRGSLWSMPAADQAALLPFVLTCVYDERRLVQVVDLAYDR